MVTLCPPQLEESWRVALEAEWEKPYLQKLVAFLAEERRHHEVYPPKEQVFQAFNHTPFDAVKVVLIGQDPYHGARQAHGLSFSVPEGVALPPSLKNIYKELESDLGVRAPLSGSLIPWAKQGVLLLNSILTVRAGEPHSHYGQGWELFTDSVVLQLAKRERPLIFVLWGRRAMEKCQFIEGYKQHVYLTAPHPSPYSASSGFFGCAHFSKINAQLARWGEEPIVWGSA